MSVRTPTPCASPVLPGGRRIPARGAESTRYLNDVPAVDRIDGVRFTPRDARTREIRTFGSAALEAGRIASFL